jgi:hypothetical protein
VIRIILLFVTVAMATSCALDWIDRKKGPELPAVNRLRNVSSKPLTVNPAAGVTGEFSIPYLDGPYPAIVLSHDDALVEDQVKEEARLLARNGFAILSCIIEGEVALQTIASAGREVTRQSGVMFPEASLVVFSGPVDPAIEAARRLSGYRLLLLVDPPEPPPLSVFEGMTDPVVVLFRSDTDPRVALWHDVVALLPARGSRVVTAGGGDAPLKGMLNPDQRELLVTLLRESYE